MKFNKEIKIALTAICTVVILFYGINFLKGVNLFKKSDLYYVIFNDITGLAKNNAVFANGFPIGTVREINYDYDHAFSMTVLNDAQGYIYSAITNFMIKETGADLAKGGYTMTIKALTGDHKHYKGALLTMTGVRFETVGGLQFGYSDNAVSTFTINGKLIEFTYTPGALQKPAGLIGAATSLLKG